LPAPFSPISACTVPRLSLNDTLSSATTPGNALRMPRISSKGAVAVPVPVAGWRSCMAVSDIL